MTELILIGVFSTHIEAQEFPKEKVADFVLLSLRNQVWYFVSRSVDSVRSDFGRLRWVAVRTGWLSSGGRPGGGPRPGSEWRPGNGLGVARAHGGQVTRPRVGVHAAATEELRTHRLGVSMLNRRVTSV
jgi:hypothetical protein